MRKDLTFEELLNIGDSESLKECREWLVAEEKRIATERSRMAMEETFFDKKMDILKNGFASLEEDRRRLEREKMNFEAEKKAAKKYNARDAYEDLTGSLFAGVNNYLALKKRYRDLLKIFHPDNMCGDSQMVILINEEYERIKNDFDMGFRSVN